MKRIIHIASFAGNIGDIVNHSGFYNAINLCEDDVCKIEMRRFYRNCRGEKKLFFDAEMAKYINTFDALVLGGGGFFDVYWDQSTTGTALDIQSGFLENIKIPVIVNAMGVFVGQNQLAKDRFGDFFVKIQELDNWHINLRNDGSLKRLINLYGNQIIHNISVVPDNGFTYRATDYEALRCELLDKNERPYIGVNITNEILDSSFVGGISIEGFYKGISDYIMKLIAMDMNIVFFLHTPQDIRVLGNVVQTVGEEKFRKKIIVAPYMPSIRMDQIDNIVNYYCLCSLVVGMRFHSNVISIANSIPAIGLCIHEQVRDLYEENKMMDQCVIVGSSEWIETLLHKTKVALDNPDEYKKNQENIRKELIINHKKYIDRIKKYLVE